MADDMDLLMECTNEDFPVVQNFLQKSPRQSSSLTVITPRVRTNISEPKPSATKNRSRAAMLNPHMAKNGYGVGSPIIIDDDDDEDDDIFIEKVTYGKPTAKVAPLRQTPPVKNPCVSISGQVVKPGNQSLAGSKNSSTGSKNLNYKIVLRNDNHTVNDTSRVVGGDEDKDSDKQVKPSFESSVSLVPLEQYYYGRKEGNPSYREKKGEFRFKCCYCQTVLCNNIRLMTHMQSHLDFEKRLNFDLSDLTQCKRCYRCFDTPYEMQCHQEKVHQNNNNMLVCRICEQDYRDSLVLELHMKSCHNACEMPYICQLCGFQSSVYSDVTAHFKKRHNHSQHLLCLYCLKLFKVSICKPGGWLLTQSYYQHIQKHQARGNNKRCPCCKLTFLTRSDIATHRTNDHLPGVRGSYQFRSTRNNSSTSLMISVREDAQTEVQCLNAAPSIQSLNLEQVKLTEVGRSYKCIECRLRMMNSRHYAKYVVCSMCRFASACRRAYTAHVSKQHAGSGKQITYAAERRLRRRMFCMCGFNSYSGNKLAEHLVACSKSTAYSRQPIIKWIEYEDNDESKHSTDAVSETTSTVSVPVRRSRRKALEHDHLIRNTPRLIGALGLVKKPPRYRSSKKVRTSMKSTAKTIISGIVDELIDSVCHAVTASHSCAVGDNTSTLTGVPNELNGSNDAVKVKDECQSSNTSISMDCDTNCDNNSMVDSWVDLKQRMSVDSSSVSASTEDAQTTAVVYTKTECLNEDSSNNMNSEIDNTEIDFDMLTSDAPLTEDYL